MTKLPQAFDPSDYAGRNTVEPGKYRIRINKADLRDSKANPNNKMIAVMALIAAGPQKGFAIWDNINFINENQMAEEIGIQKLAQLCDAIGHKGKLKDTDELLDTECLAFVDVQESENFPPRNRIAEYAPLEEKLKKRKKDKKKNKEQEDDVGWD